jgi:hypothetical protein
MAVTIGNTKLILLALDSLQDQVGAVSWEVAVSRECYVDEIIRILTIISITYIGFCHVTIS